MYLLDLCTDVSFRRLDGLSSVGLVMRYLAVLFYRYRQGLLLLEFPSVTGMLDVLVQCLPYIGIWDRNESLLGQRMFKHNRSN